MESVSGGVGDIFLCVGLIKSVYKQSEYRNIIIAVLGFGYFTVYLIILLIGTY